MKTIKYIGLLFLSVAFWSCSDDEVEVELSEEPTFTVTVSPDDPSVYFFENTTPNKADFYSFWEFDLGGAKGADNEEGPVRYKYTSAGDKTVTLTMVGTSTFKTASKSISVTLPEITDSGYLINPENLLLNGYLVDGTGNEFEHWTKQNGADNLTAETEDPLIGSRALRVSNSAEGDPWSTQFISDEFPTEIDKEYTVSLWVKGAEAVIRVSTNAGLDQAQYGPDYTVTSDWGQYKYTFTAKTETTNIALDMGASAASFIVDAIEVVEGEKALPLPSNDSELLNGGLEEGAGDDFENWTAQNGPERFTQETTDVLSGQRALRVSNPEEGDPWSAQFISDEFPTVIDEEYTVSLWVKGAEAVIRVSTNAGLDQAQYGPDYTVTGEWGQYKYTFTAKTETTNIALDLGASAASFVIDNIKVVKE